ncbi:hypothetical protein QTP88_021314 [Uroleucon formosanum]
MTDDDVEMTVCEDLGGLAGRHRRTRGRHGPPGHRQTYQGGNILVALDSLTGPLFCWQTERSKSVSVGGPDRSCVSRPLRKRLKSRRSQDSAGGGGIALRCMHAGGTDGRRSGRSTAGHYVVWGSRNGMLVNDNMSTGPGEWGPRPGPRALHVYVNKNVWVFVFYAALFTAVQKYGNRFDDSTPLIIME